MPTSSAPTGLYKAQPPGHPAAIWAAFVAQGRWKSWVLVALLALLALLVLANIRASSRPPDVVLISPDGQSTYVPATVASDALVRWIQETKQLPSDLTVIRFAQLFLRLALELNSSTVEATWPEALALMAPPLAAKMRHEAAVQKLIEGTQLARVKTQLAFDDLVLVERAGGLLHLRASLTRTKRSLFGEEGREQPDHLSVDLIARVIPRSLSHPDGLEVAEWTVRTVVPPAPTPEAPNATR
jgi:hypothetical protein